METGKNDSRVRDTKTISEAQIIVDNPDSGATKTGEAHLMFGNWHDHETEYNVYASTSGSINFVKQGASSKFSFRGSTKTGVAVEGTVACSQTDDIRQYE